MSHDHPHHGLGFRPTESFVVGAPRDTLRTRLREGLAAHAEGLDTRWAGEHLLFSLKPARRTFYSPWLSVALRESEGGEGESTRVVAQFCPHPQLWSAVMLANIGLAGLLILATGFGWAQLTLDRSPWAFWVAFGSILTALGLWLGSHAARHLAREQMLELWTTLLEALETEEN